MEMSDYLAMTAGRDEDKGFGGNAFLWVILIFLFFLAFNGNGIFGGNRAVDNGGVSTVDRDVLTSSCNTDKEILTSRYENALAINGVQAQIAGLKSDMQSCCCELKTQMLADKYESAQSELNLARIVASNQTQTQTLLSTMGKWVANAPASTSDTTTTA